VARIGSGLNCGVSILVGSLFRAMSIEGREVEKGSIVWASEFLGEVIEVVFGPIPASDPSEDESAQENFPSSVGSSFSFVEFGFFASFFFMLEGLELLKLHPGSLYPVIEGFPLLFGFFTLDIYL
jgi:hypothetical protein